LTRERKAPREVTRDKMFARAARDGSKTVRIQAYPTEREAVKWRVAQKAFGFWSMSELITAAVKEMDVKTVRYVTTLTGAEAEKAEILAEAAGYPSAEAWFSEGLRQSVVTGWAERTQLIAPDIP